MLQNGGVKIWRPRQASLVPSYVISHLIIQLFSKIYVGPGKRDYMPIEEREAVEGPGKTPTAVLHSGCVTSN